MQILKKIMLFIIDPFKKFGSLGISERITVFLNKKKPFLYLLALITTIIVFYFVYFK